MTARTTTSRRRSTKAEAPSIDVELDAEVNDDAPKVPARKYFSHSNCDHARKGEAGKAARAACRRSIRSWLKAEAEYLEEAVPVAV